MRTAAFFLLLGALILAGRLCHSNVLWAEEDYPITGALQVRAGHALYRDVWFDKPPLLPLLYATWPVHAGVVLRLAGSAYVLLTCWLAWLFAKGLWGENEGRWAAALLGFFLTFDTHSAVIPVATDLAMLAPHIAAVYLAWRGRAFWSGVVCGVALLVNPKGVFVLGVCLVWSGARVVPVLGGFAASSALGLGLMWWLGALPGYWLQVWQWGRLYAGSSFVNRPVWNGIVRTSNWLGFHAALAIGAGWFALRARGRELAPWALWVLIAFAGVCVGWRFFPRYYFLLLPPMVLMAARSRELRKCMMIAMLVPLIRFGPRYIQQARGVEWADTAMDRDSRAAAEIVRRSAKAGDTLFVWGFRTDLFVYSQLTAGSRFLDSQPLNGVPADRHLTQNGAVDFALLRENRAELVRSRPTFVVDGLGLYNPTLAIARYDDLRAWMAQYREIGRTAGAVVYELANRGTPLNAD